MVFRAKFSNADLGLFFGKKKKKNIFCDFLVLLNHSLFCWITKLGTNMLSYFNLQPSFNLQWCCVLEENYLSTNIQWPQEGLNCKSLAFRYPESTSSLLCLIASWVVNYFICKRFSSNPTVVTGFWDPNNCWAWHHHQHHRIKMYAYRLLWN